MKLRPELLITAAAALLLGIAPAKSHPHMFAEAKLDVTLTPDGKAVQKLKHLWTFDDVSSSMMLVDLDMNGDMQLDAQELDEGSKIMLESMAEYDYFQIVTHDGQDIKMAPPKNIVVRYENNQLTVSFEAAPASALPLNGKTGIGVYDPTFYVSIDFVHDTAMNVANIPANCASAVVRPDPDEAIAQNQSTIDQAFRDDAANNDMGKIFATRLELTCQANG